MESTAPDVASLNDTLIQKLKGMGVIQTAPVEAAFRAIPRHLSWPKTLSVFIIAVKNSRGEWWQLHLSRDEIFGQDRSEPNARHPIRSTIGVPGREDVGSQATMRPLSPMDKLWERAVPR